MCRGQVVLKLDGIIPAYQGHKCTDKSTPQQKKVQMTAIEEHPYRAAKQTNTEETTPDIRGIREGRQEHFNRHLRHEGRRPS